jgi:mono/diheme cytochrome c family protein
MKRLELLAIVVGLASSAAHAQEPSPPVADYQGAFPIAAWSRTSAAVETQGAPVERGAAVFNNWCSACHSRGPQNAPGTASLQIKYQGSVPAALEDRRDLTPEVVKVFVRNGVAMMAPFRKTEVSDADLDALAAYLTR